MKRACVLFIAIAGCDRTAAVSPTRALVFEGVPRCAGKSTYARPIVVRLDRDRAFFEEAWAAQLRIDAPTNVAPTLEVVRRRMKVTMRVGLCSATSLGTWDCEAATWLATEALVLDAKTTPAAVKIPKIDAPCTALK